MNDNAEVFERMGVKKGDLGSHSVRKGSITLVSSGCTVSPPMSSICLRACWSMGPVKDTYIHYEKAGDQFVGRSVTGISSLSKQFAVSPAYFDSSGSEEGTMKKIDDIIYVFLSGKRDEVLGPVFLLVRFMFASICFHYNHLDENIAAGNPFRACAMFIAASEPIRRCAVIKFPWNKSDETPLFTGIPPHVIMMSEMEVLKEVILSQKGDILYGLKEELNKRNIGGDTFQANGILEEVNRVHSRMMEVMKPGNSNSNLGRNASELADYIHVQEDEDEEANVEDHFASQPTMNDVESRGLIIQWKNCMNGRISLLPKAYKFPSMPLPNFIRMWYCGDKPKNVPPYKMLRHADLTGLKSYKQKITNMKKLIFHVERAACDLLFRPELIKRQ